MARLFAALCAAVVGAAALAATFAEGADPAEEVLTTYDVIGTYYAGGLVCHEDTTYDTYPFELLSYESNTIVNVTALDGTYVTISVDCDNANLNGAVQLTVYDAQGNAHSFQPSTTSTACISPLDGYAATANLGVVVHKPQQVLSVPANWVGTFELQSTTTVPDSSLCRLGGSITVSTVGNVVEVVGFPTNRSACYNEYQNGITIYSPPVADVTTLYRFSVAVNGYVFTINRVQYEGAVEVFYDLPYSPPTGRFNCVLGNCQPIQFSGTTVIAGTLALVFGVPIFVIACLGLQQSRGRVHDE